MVDILFPLKRTWAIYFSGGLTFFFILIFLFLAGGCAKQRVFTPPAAQQKTPTIRVAIDDNVLQGKLLFLDEFVLRSEEADYILDASLGEFTVTYNGKELVFLSEMRWFAFEDFKEIKFIPHTGMRFIWNGSTYEGELIFAREENRVSVISRVDIPAYLQGVIPYEIPSHTEEYYQAILSQAVAARTYAMYHIRNPRSSHYDIYADTRDQVYRGKDNNAPLVEKAVRETTGMVIEAADHSLVRIQYHSTCGGVLDPASYQMENTIAGGTIIKDDLGSTANCTASPLYRWVRTMDSRNLLTNLVRLGFLNSGKKAELIENGYDIDLSISSRKESGRVDKLVVLIDGESFDVHEWQLRSLLADEAGNPLPSNLFLLKASRNDDQTFYIVGAGFGHGRGLCQWGAIGQALQGKSFREILRFYYPDLILTRIY